VKKIGLHLTPKWFRENGYICAFMHISVYDEIGKGRDRETERQRDRERERERTQIVNDVLG
jgi:hypothetical protein